MAAEKWTEIFRQGAKTLPYLAATALVIAQSWRTGLAIPTIGIFLALSFAILFVFGKTRPFLALFVISIVAFAGAEIHGGIFSDGTLTHADYPFHAHLSNELASSLANFGTTWSWSDSFQAGYHPFYDLPPGEYILALAFRAISLNLLSPEGAQRAVVFLAVPLAAIALAYFSRKTGQALETACLAGTLFLMSYNDLFVISNTRFYFSTAFALFGLGFAFEGKKTENETANKNWLTGRTALSALLLAVSIAFHSFLGLLALLCLAVLARTNAIGKASVVSIPLALAPNALYVLSYVSSSEYLGPIYANIRENWRFIFDLKANFEIFLFKASPTVAVFLALSIGLALFSAVARKSSTGKKRTQLFLAVFVASLGGVLHFAREAFPQLAIAGNLDKIFSLAFAFAAAAAAEEMLSSRGLEVLAFGTCAITTAFFIAYFFSAFGNPGGYAFHRHASEAFGYEGAGFEEIYGIEMENGIFSSEEKGQTRELAEYLAELDGNQRVLLNLNGDSDGHVYGGFAYSLFPERTGKRYIGGPSFNMDLPLSGSFSSNSRSDKLFGIPAGELASADLEDLLRTLNIGTACAWNGKVKEALLEKPYFNLTYSTSGGLFSCYNFTLKPDSYIFELDSEKGLTIPLERAEIVKFSPKEKEFLIRQKRDAPKTLVLSQRYSSEWVLYFGKEKLRTWKGKYGLTEFALPILESENNGGEVLLFKYEEPLLFFAAKLFSVGAFFGLAFASLNCVEKARKGGQLGR